MNLENKEPIEIIVEAQIDRILLADMVRYSPPLLTPYLRLLLEDIAFQALEGAVEK